MDAIKEYVRPLLSDKRWKHTLGVAEAAEKLADYLLPECKDEIILAALLHDVAKELPIEDQLALILSEALSVSDEDLATVPALHSFAGAALVKRDLPDLASDAVVSAIFNHTLGDPDMTLFDKIIYIADYVEPTRTAEACISVRSFLFDNLEKGKRSENLRVLNSAIIKAIDNTYAYLCAKGLYVNSKMLKTKKSLSAFI